jgi:hypothetical protein
VPSARKDPAAGKDTFISELRTFYEECGSPTHKQLANLSKDLPNLYPLPSGERRLPYLSKATISEILAGKRRGLPASEWVASFVLACQRCAVNVGILDDDPGPSSLPGWQDRLRAAKATGASGGPSAPQPRSAPDHVPVLLPPRHRAFVSGHGPYADHLLVRAKAGDPDALYRVALLLGTDPDRTSDAQSLLLQAAADGHRPSIDLLDENPADDLPPAAAAKRAFTIAQTAEANGRADEARALYAAAARGGVAEAVKRASAMLEKRGLPEAAWLSPPDDAADKNEDDT